MNGLLPAGVRCAILWGLVAQGAAAAPSTAPCMEYASQLAVMVSTDHAMRSRWDMQQLFAIQGNDPPKILAQTALVDQENTRRLKRLVRSCGWPQRQRDGQSAVDDVWLIVQHADHDRPFQRAFLAEVQRRLKVGEGSPVQMAYLSDRLDVADQKPQQYGTQLVQNGPCQFEFSALDDRSLVEQRRKALGWPSLDEYRKLVHENLVAPDCQSAGTPGE